MRPCCSRVGSVEPLPDPAPVPEPVPVPVEPAPPPPAVENLFDDALFGGEGDDLLVGGSWP